jgi:hypothetical protein
MCHIDMDICPISRRIEWMNSALSRGRCGSSQPAKVTTGAVENVLCGKGKLMARIDWLFWKNPFFIN